MSEFNQIYIITTILTLIGLVGLVGVIYWKFKQLTDPSRILVTTVSKSNNLVTYVGKLDKNLILAGKLTFTVDSPDSIYRDGIFNTQTCFADETKMQTINLRQRVNKNEPPSDEYKKIKNSVIAEKIIQALLTPVIDPQTSLMIIVGAVLVSGAMLWWTINGKLDTIIQIMTGVA